MTAALPEHYPIPRTPHLAGEYPGHRHDPAVVAARVDALLGAGVTLFVDLTEPVDWLVDYAPVLAARARDRAVTHVRHAIPDGGATTDAHLREIVALLDRAAAEGTRAYVHCWGGIGRTGMVVASLPVRRGLTVDEALAAVAAGFASMPKSARPRHAHRTSPEAACQVEAVHRFAAFEARRHRTLGAILGGAIGDALGWPVEFESLARIRATHGDDGVTELRADPALGAAAITDDTQMTLFTAEGLLAGLAAARRTGGDVRAAVHDAMVASHRRWHATQRRGAPAAARDDAGWLLRIPALHADRAPGLTCMGALARHDFGAPAMNDSKGNGGVMRVAPCGLVASLSGDDAWAIACATARLTHGHPSGWLAAGAFAVMIRTLLDGATIAVATEAARGHLRAVIAQEPLARETLDALDAGEALVARHPLPTAEQLETLGEGKVAEEALGMAVACALVGERTGDVALALRLAVNHSGDSDSTGSIAGQLLGTRLGVEALPVRWRDGVELRAVLARVAEDLAAERVDDDAWGALARA